jgi:hypothetical protein
MEHSIVGVAAGLILYRVFNGKLYFKIKLFAFELTGRRA